jgi:histidine triad (HIT) family protein
MPDCLFCKIRDGEIPADIVYSDDHCLAFRDLHPAAPVHVLIIPRRHIASLNEVDAAGAEIIGALFAAVPAVAAELGVAEGGYRVVVNCNADAGQEIFHLHFHLLGGRQLGWPPG